MKKSFILHLDSLEIFDELTNEQAGILFKAIKSYNEGKEIELDFALRLAFLPFKKQFERDFEKYENVCNRNKNNGLSGGRPKKPKKTEKTHSVISKPKKADNDNDNDSDNVNDNDNEKEVLLQKWILYRNQIKKKLSESTIEQLREKMNTFSIEKCTFAINNSISNGWQGLFWEKYEEPKQKPTYYEMPL